MAQLWSQAEIAIVVAEYFRLLQGPQDAQNASGSGIVKGLERCLPSRTRGAITFKMQNISDVIEDLNRTQGPEKQHIPLLATFRPRSGFLDTAEVQEALKVSVVEVACKHKLLTADKLTTLFPDWQPASDRGAFDQRVARLRRKTNLPYPTGNPKPKKVSRQGTVYERDPLVRAWVLQQAKGRCELCNWRAFKDQHDEPYLEGHHIDPLSEGGPDTPANTAALCPNCHRALHFSTDAKKLRERVRGKVAKREAAHRSLMGDVAGREA